MKTSIALVGCGRWAQSVHIPYLKNNDLVELKILTGVLKRSEGTRLADRYGFEKYVHPWDKASMDPGVEAAVISTPHALHFEQIECFLKAGKHVHVDKPPTLKSSEFAWLQKYADDHGLILSVHSQMKYMPGVDKVRSILATDFSGIYQVNACIWQKLFNDFKSSWRSDMTLAGGGIMLDSGYHMADTVHYLLKNKRSMRPSFLTHTGARNTGDTVGLLTYGLGDTIISISSIRGAPRSAQSQKIEFFGDNGYIKLTVTKQETRDLSTVQYQDMAGRNRIFKYPHYYNFRADPLQMFIEGVQNSNPYVLAEIKSNAKISLSVIGILEKAYHKNSGVAT